MGDPPAPGARLARGAPGGVRRPVVPAGGDELRDQDREDDLARELGLRTAPRAGRASAQTRNVPRSRRICTKRATPAGSARRARYGRRPMHPEDPAGTARPDGIPGSSLTGPWPVGQYADAAARPAARALARAGLRRGVQPAGGARAGVVRAARRARGAAVLDVARGLRRGSRRRSPTACASWPRAAATSTRARARRRRRSPSPSPTCGSPARATCSRSSTGCAARSTPRGCSSRRSGSPRAALPRCIGVVTGEGGKARDDVLAGLRRRGWAGRRRVGVRAGAGPPRGSRGHPRAAGPGGAARRSTRSSSRAAAARSPTCSPSATRRCAGPWRCCACR